MTLFSLYNKHINCAAKESHAHTIACLTNLQCGTPKMCLSIVRISIPSRCKLYP